MGNQWKSLFFVLFVFMIGKVNGQQKRRDDWQSGFQQSMRNFEKEMDNFQKTMQNFANRFGSSIFQNDRLPPPPPPPILVPLRPRGNRGKQITNSKTENVNEGPAGSPISETEGLQIQNNLDCQSEEAKRTCEPRSLFPRFKTTQNCVNVNMQPLRPSMDEMVTERKSLGLFNKIVNAGFFNVTILPSEDQPRLSVTADPAYIDKVFTEIHDGTLVLYFDCRYIPVCDGEECNHAGVKINIYTPPTSLNGIYISGSGPTTMHRHQPFSARNFDAVVTGSGEMNLNLNVPGEIRISVTGSGNINLKKGKVPTSSAQYLISGSGIVNGGYYNVKRADICITGAGHVTTAAKKLSAVITGSGSIDVVGRTRIIRNCNTGVGRISQCTKNAKGEISCGM